VWRKDKSKHWGRPTRVTAADALPNTKRRSSAEVTNQSVPRKDHRIEVVRYFAKGLERSAPTVTEENGMPTVQNLSKVQRENRVRGENRT